MYYVISRGLHPFGDVLRHQANIAAGDYNLSALQADGLCFSHSLVIGLLVRYVFCSKQKHRFFHKSCDIC